MLKVEDILREDFDWEDIEIDEDEFDELETALIIDYLKKIQTQLRFIGKWLLRQIRFMCREQL